VTAENLFLQAREAISGIMEISGSHGLSGVDLHLLHQDVCAENVVVSEPCHRITSTSNVSMSVCTRSYGNIRRGPGRRYVIMIDWEPLSSKVSQEWTLQQAQDLLSLLSTIYVSSSPRNLHIHP